MFCASVGGGKSFEIKIIQFTFVQSAKKKKKDVRERRNTGGCHFFLFRCSCCLRYVYIFIYVYMIHGVKSGEHVNRLKRWGVKTSMLLSLCVVSCK